MKEAAASSCTALPAPPAACLPAFLCLPVSLSVYERQRDFGYEVSVSLSRSSVSQSVARCRTHTHTHKYAQTTTTTPAGFVVCVCAVVWHWELSQNKDEEEDVGEPAKKEAKKKKKKRRREKRREKERERRPQKIIANEYASLAPYFEPEAPLFTLSSPSLFGQKVAVSCTSRRRGGGGRYIFHLPLSLFRPPPSVSRHRLWRHVDVRGSAAAAASSLGRAVAATVANGRHWPALGSDDTASSA